MKTTLLNETRTLLKKTQEDYDAAKRKVLKYVKTGDKKIVEQYLELMKIYSSQATLLEKNKMINKPNKITKEWLINNRMDENGVIDLTGIDFNELEDNIDFGDMKLKGEIYTSDQKVKGNLYYI